MLTEPMRHFSGWPALLLAATTFLASSCSKSEQKDRLLLDVKALVNKQPAEVEEILGAPDSAYTVQVMGRSIYCQRYYPYNIEIQYRESTATDFVIYGPHELPFDQTSLSAFGFDYKKQHPSDYRKGTYMRWSNLDGFSAISFYNTTKDSVGDVVDFNIFFKAGKGE